MPTSKLNQTFKIDRGNSVRAIARERVGQPPAKRVIKSKKQKPVKHKERFDDATN